MAIPRIRTRGWNHPNLKIGTSTIWDTSGGGGWISPGTSVYYPAQGVTLRAYDEVCNDETHPGPPYKEGGPFFCKKRDMPIRVVDSGTFIRGNLRYDGQVVCIPPSFAEANGYTSWAQGHAAGYGAKGWNKFRPVKPVNSLGQFIAELRDVKGMVTGLKRRLKSLKDAGHHYLNYQFGWKPFLSDLQSFLNNGEKIARRIRFARKNNGKWIKRGGTISQTDEEIITTVGYRMTPTFGGMYFYPPSFNPSPTYQTVSLKSHIWFEAMMKYYIPNLGSDQAKDLWTSPILRTMWGMDLTPSLVWEILPWSWLVDWFWDVGDIFANISNNFYDNLVAKYAYVMETRSLDVKFQCTQRIHVQDSYNAPVHDRILNLNESFSSSSKERAEASPFGFSLSPDWSNLTGRQIAILFALGATRT